MNITNCRCLGISSVCRWFANLWFANLRTTCARLARGKKGGLYFRNRLALLHEVFIPQPVAPQTVFKLLRSTYANECIPDNKDCYTLCF